jgi:hypothetical protein
VKYLIVGHSFGITKAVNLDPIPFSGLFLIAIIKVMLANPRGIELSEISTLSPSAR